MNLNQIGVIANKYDLIITKTVGTPAATVIGEFPYGVFEAEAIEVAKHPYLDLVVFDTTALADSADILKAVRFLKLHLSDNVRIILLAPNLDDKGIIQQLLVYGVYDIVNPTINENEMDDFAIESKLSADLNYIISEPTTFDKVVDNLAIEAISQEVINIYKNDPATEQDAKNQKDNTTVTPKTPLVFKKSRVLCVYDEKRGDEAFAKVKMNSKYSVVDCMAFNEEAISNIDLANIDVIAFDNVDPSTIGYVVRLVEVNENKAIIVAGYDNFDAQQMADKLEAVRTFLYDGTANSYARLLSVAISSKHTATVARTCRTYAVYGVKGGVGSTTLTTILAKDYAARHPKERVLVIDFNSRAGDVAEKFGITTLVPNLFQYILSMGTAKRKHIDLSQLRDKVNEYIHYSKENGVFVLPTAFSDIYSFTEYKFDTVELAHLYNYAIECCKQSFDAIFLDVCKYSGFTYDIATQHTDKLILVGDSKLSSTSHMLQKLNEVDKDGLVRDRTFVIINRSNAKTNEKEYENLNIVIDRASKEKVLHLPFDKELYNENTELQVKYGKKFKKELNKVWDMLYPAPSNKK